MAQKPSIPKGTRDFSPLEMAKRNYIFDTIKQVYQLYGFQQIETPAMETLGTLMGKYGEEGDKLLFKVLNSGDFLNKVSDEELQERNALHLAAKLCEKGLRYDLTVPFARYVVMHREELQLPFKRYQMQPVWRADRPQKGRYREFWQFDGDIVGSDSLLNEVELMQIVDAVFSRFGVRVQIKINNRKILTGIAEVIGAADKIVDITVAIDKLDKIGLDNVNQELREDGLSEDQIEKLQAEFTEHKVDSWRNEILQFARSCTNRQRHTKEDFDHVLETIDKYKRYIKANELINGQVDVAEEYIKEIYKQCLRENDFIPDKPPKNYVEQERKARGRA